MIKVIKMLISPQKNPSKLKANTISISHADTMMKKAISGLSINILYNRKAAIQVFSQVDAAFELPSIKKILVDENESQIVRGRASDEVVGKSLYLR